MTDEGRAGTQMNSSEKARTAEGEALLNCTHGIVTFTRGCLICGDPAFTAELLDAVEAALAAENNRKG